MKRMKARTSQVHFATCEIQLSSGWLIKMETAAQGHPELDGFAESQCCVFIYKGEKVKNTTCTIRSQPWDTKWFLKMEQGLNKCYKMEKILIVADVYCRRNISGLSWRNVIQKNINSLSIDLMRTGLFFSLLWVSTGWGGPRLWSGWFGGGELGDERKTSQSS